MEPFALFNLLQSLFPQSPSQNAANNPTDTAPQNESEPPDKNVPSEQHAPEEPSSAQEAALRFLSAHDSRSKRTKKS
ncbi:MAG: hypothetical protein IJ329_01195 [Clostridia bacterium]|nr:hypothetical protein [Clostridia bacterium]